MTIAERQVGSVKVLDLVGKLELSDQTGHLKDKVSDLMTGGHKNVVLNLSGLTYIDSSGLGELVSCHTTSKKNEGVLKLTNPSKKAHDLLVMTKLQMVFDVYTNEAEALASFAK